MQSNSMTTMMHNLEIFRVEHGYSMEKFASMLDMSKSAYCKLVRGDTNKLSVDSLQRIYEVTGKLCYQLMEIFTDDYLIIGQMINDFDESEMRFMKKFVEVYMETRKRLE